MLEMLVVNHPRGLSEYNHWLQEVLMTQKAKPFHYCRVLNKSWWAKLESERGTQVKAYFSNCDRCIRVNF